MNGMVYDTYIRHTNTTYLMPGKSAVDGEADQFTEVTIECDVRIMLCIFAENSELNQNMHYLIHIPYCVYVYVRMSMSFMLIMHQ